MCSVYLCRSIAGEKDVSFHAFPHEADGERRYEWIKYCGHPTELFLKPHSKICSKHFSRDQFMRDPEFSLKYMGKGARMQLKKCAVPNVPMAKVSGPRPIQKAPEKNQVPDKEIEDHIKKMFKPLKIRKEPVQEVPDSVILGIPNTSMVQISPVIRETRSPDQGTETPRRSTRMSLRPNRGSVSYKQDTIEIEDDDEVDTPPQAKEKEKDLEEWSAERPKPYHRPGPKSSQSRRSSLRRRSSKYNDLELGVHMECTEEKLSDCQLWHLQKQNTNSTAHRKLLGNLEELSKKGVLDLTFLPEYKALENHRQLTPSNFHSTFGKFSLTPAVAPTMSDSQPARASSPEVVILGETPPKMAATPPAPKPSAAVIKQPAMPVKHIPPVVNPSSVVFVPTSNIGTSPSSLPTGSLMSNSNTVANARLAFSKLVKSQQNLFGAIQNPGQSARMRLIALNRISNPYNANGTSPSFTIVQRSPTMMNRFSTPNIPTTVNNLNTPSLNESPSVLKRPTPPSEGPQNKRQKTGDDHEKAVGSWVPLDEYYYGKMEGNPTYEEDKGEFRFKCWYCNKMLYNNIKAMMHIQGHIDSGRQHNIDLSDLTQCKHCFKQFDTPFEMQTHVDKVHTTGTKVLVCRICEHDHESRHALTNHMRRNHNPCEMPYICQLCQFRSSMYSDVVDHFKKKHDSSSYILCLYCLRVFRTKFVSQGWGNTQTYYGHLLKHQTKHSSKKCNFCRLTFINIQDAKSHKVNDHKANHKGVIGANSKYTTKGQVMIKVPESGRLHSKQEKVKSLNAPEVSKMLDFGGTKFPAAVNYLSCLECKMSMGTPDHFKKFISCSMCRFATSCSIAYANHMMGFHSGQMSSLNLNIPWEHKMNSKMFCLCGFGSSYGNRIANHLVYCSKRTCYSSRPDVQEAYSSMQLEDEQDPRKKPGASLLDVLGLVKKKVVATIGSEDDLEVHSSNTDSFHKPKITPVAPIKSTPVEHPKVSANIAASEFGSSTGKKGEGRWLKVRIKDQKSPTKESVFLGDTGANEGHIKDEEKGQAQGHLNRETQDKENKDELDEDNLEDNKLGQGHSCGNSMKDISASSLQSSLLLSSSSDDTNLGQHSPRSSNAIEKEDEEGKPGTAPNKTENLNIIGASEIDATALDSDVSSQHVDEADESGNTVKQVVDDSSSVGQQMAKEIEEMDTNELNSETVDDVDVSTETRQTIVGKPAAMSDTLDECTTTSQELVSDSNTSSLHDDDESSITAQNDELGTASQQNENVDKLNTTPQQEVGESNIKSQPNLDESNTSPQQKIDDSNTIPQQNVDELNTSSQQNAELNTSSQQNVDELNTSSQQSVEELNTTSQQSVDVSNTTSQQNVEELNTSSQQNVESNTTSQQSVEELNTTSQQNVDELNTSSQQSVDELNTSSQQSVDELNTTSQQSVDELNTTSQQNVESNTSSQPNVDVSNTSQQNVEAISTLQPSESNTKPQANVDVSITTSQPNVDVSNTTSQPNVDVSNTTSQPNVDVSNTTPQPNVDKSNTTPQPNVDKSNTTPQPNVDKSNTMSEPLQTNKASFGTKAAGDCSSSSVDKESPGSTKTGTVQGIRNISSGGDKDNSGGVRTHSKEGHHPSSSPSPKKEHSGNYRDRSQERYHHGNRPHDYRHDGYHGNKGHRYNDFPRGDYHGGQSGHWSQQQRPYDDRRYYQDERSGNYHGPRHGHYDNDRYHGYHRDPRGGYGNRGGYRGNHRR